MTPSTRQEVTFESCVFENMKFGLYDVLGAFDTFANEYPNVKSMVFASNSANSVFFQDCIFLNNEYSGEVCSR